MTIHDQIKNMNPKELFDFLCKCSYETSSFEKPQCKFCKASFSPKCNLQWCETAFIQMCNIEIWQKK